MRVVGIGGFGAAFGLLCVAAARFLGAGVGSAWLSGALGAASAASLIALWKHEDAAVSAIAAVVGFLLLAAVVFLMAVYFLSGAFDGT